MSSSKVFAIVPIRIQPSTKHRLARSLDAPQRRRLVQSMLVDVIKAITQSHLISRFAIVTSDKEFLADYYESVFELHRSNVQGLNLELEGYLTDLGKKDIGHAIIILGDLPMLSGTVLDEIIQSGLKANRPVIAKDWRGKGTNVLFFPFPKAFKLQFGENSFEKHMLELETVGSHPIIYHAMETALDIDDDAAIEQFLILARADAKIRETKTYRLLRVDEKRSGKVA